MSRGRDQETSFSASLKRVGSSLMEGVEDRLQLLALDLQSEKLRLVPLLVGLLVGLFAAFMAMLSLNVLLLLIFWDRHRLLVGTALFVFYMLLAMVLGLFVRRRLKTAPTPFGSTLEVLRKDREALTGEDS
jgi:uncharacterized membrane protein YqjE